MNRAFFRTITIVLLMAAFAAGCNNKSQVSKNIIQRMPLSTEQKKIVDLLVNSKNDIEIFSYKTNEQYKKIDIWTEIYENGELVNDNAGGVSIIPMENTNPSGEIALIISKNPDFQWTFIVQDDAGGKISSTSEPCELYKNGYSYGPMKNAVEIEDGKEIVLYTSLFSNENGSAMGINDEQQLIMEPELLKAYSYAHIIKCKFEGLVNYTSVEKVINEHGRIISEVGKTSL